jgi:hypothetical protein
VRKLLTTTDLDDDQINAHFTQLYSIGKSNVRRMMFTVEEFFRLKEIPQNDAIPERELMAEAAKMTAV